MLQYQATDKWMIQGAVRWVPQETPVDNMNTLYADPYVVVDLRSEYRVNDTISIFGEITNLFNETYAASTLVVDQARPDQAAFLPGDGRGLVIDAKFPLEGFTLFREAKGDEARNRAAARVRNDMLVHVKDIAEKYLIPGETQDVAMLFVPAESIYADLAEHFDDVVQKAHRARIVIVSPSLLTLAVQVMQALVRDARIREEARVIQVEVQKLLEDVVRLDARVAKLDTERAPQLAAQLGIRSIPTLALFLGGREIARHSGAVDLATLKRWVDSRLAQAA